MSAAAPAVTVLTATYDRVGTLERLWRSLLGQTFRDFEWLVVDDGSTDGTDAACAEWARSSPFPIEHVWQPNRGKHVALNRGVERARGRMCAMMDSDDWYLPNALERMLHHWGAIEDESGYASVEGLTLRPDGSLVGTRFPADVFDSDTFEIRAVHGVRGDTMGMHRTEVLRAFPFPEDLGGFVPEAVVWNRIAERFRSRFVNEPLAYKEYLSGGLSAGGAAASIRAAPGYRLLFAELAASRRRMPLRHRARAHANHVRYSLHAGSGLRRQLSEPGSRVAWLAALPVGAALYARDRRRFE